MIATITTDGKHILADIPYAGGAGRDKAHEVPGCHAHYVDEKFQYWRYPLTMDTCRTFRRVFGDELQVTHALSAWARFQIQAEEDVEKLKQGGTVVWDRLPREAPALHNAIMTRGYQSTGAGWMLLAGQSILGDEPGLGKTLQTLAALVESDAKVILVTCPRTATRNVWMRETNRWAPTIAPWVAQGSRAERERVIKNFVDFPGPRKMLIVNTEMVRAKRVEVCSLKDPAERKSCLSGEISFEKHHHKYIPDPEWPTLHAIKWDAVVMDESHRLLASTANTQSKRITQGRFGAMHIRKNVKPHGLAFSLSGTPYRSNLTKAWGQLNWCRPDVWTSFWNFAGTHFGVTEGRYGRVIAEGAKVPQPLDEVQWAKAIGPYVLQRDKAMAAPDLPSIHYVGAKPEDNPFGLAGVWLEMEPKQAQAYKKMEAMAQVQLKGGTLRAVGILAEITRLRQFAISTGELYRAERRKVFGGNEYVYNEDEFSPCLPSNKIEWLIQFLIEREGYNSKIVVASNFTQVLKLIRAEIKKQLKEDCFMIAGETSDKERERVVQKFNDWDDGTRVCLLQAVAGGEAITLDTCCDDMVLIDPCWTSDQEFQLVSRIHRVSRIHQVMVHRLFSLGTVDDWMASNTEDQRIALIAARPDDIIRSLNGQG
jgi:SNF2 family DNA or RNA helicase